MKLFYQNKFWITLFIFITCFLKVNAQQSFSFLQEIQQLETKFDVKFSYAITSIENIQLQQKISTSTTLNEALIYINTHTLLVAEKIDDRFISIAPKLENIKVCGFILNKESKPISNVSILISGKFYGTVSNDNGEFVLENLKITDIIEFRYLGFATLKKNVNELIAPNLNCVTIILFEDEVELTEVFIQNYITKNLSKSNDGTISLDTKSFNTLSGQVEPDLLQTSQILPGIESPNESISNINVRNGVSDQNVIYWDYIKMYNPTHFFGLISAINPNLTKKISIIKNGTSAKYIGGVSSTMLLETNATISDNFSGGAGSNFIYYDAFFNIPISNKIELKTSFRNSNNNWFNTPTYKSYFNKTFQNTAINNNQSNSNFNFYDVNVSVLYTPTKFSSIKVNYIKINNNLDYNEFNNNNLTDKINQNSDAIGVHYDFKVNEKMNASVSSYYSKYSLFSNNYQNNQEQFVNHENEVLENSIKTSLKYLFNKNLSFETGYQLNETGVLNKTYVNIPLYNRIEKNVILNHAAFAEVNYQNNNWFLRSGISFNYFSKINETSIEPRLNLSYSLDKTMSLNAQFENKSQNTSQVIDYLDDFLGVETRRWVIADETIPLIKSDQFSVGGTYKKNNLLIDLSVFYKTIDGILISGQGFQNQVINKRLSGEQKSKGIEILLNKKTKKADFWIAYTFSKSDLFYKQLNQNYFPSNNDIRHSSTLGLNYYFNKYLSTSISGILKSGKPYATINNQNQTIENNGSVIVNYNMLNSERLKSYSRLDFSVNYQFLDFKKIQSTIKLGVLNALNKRTDIDVYYVVDKTDTTKATEITVKSMDFTPNVSLRINF